MNYAIKAVIPSRSSRYQTLRRYEMCDGNVKFEEYWICMRQKITEAVVERDSTAPSKGAATLQSCDELVQMQDCVVAAEQLKVAPKSVWLDWRIKRVGVWGNAVIKKNHGTAQLRLR
jgi:hypothetical protein